MLGFIISEQPGQSEALLRDLAPLLARDGLRLCGALQETRHPEGSDRHEMVLHLLPDGPEIGISQYLGQDATGCSLDPDGLERAAGWIAAALETRPDLLLLNKFGKQEAEGHGFRQVIGQALAQDTPVLIGVGRDKLAAFNAFADGLAEELPRNLATLADWARANTRV